MLFKTLTTDITNRTFNEDSKELQQTLYGIFNDLGFYITITVSKIC